MLRILFACLLIVHGIVQALGFFKEFNLEQVNQMSGKTLFPLSNTASKIIGVLWLVSAFLFLGTAVFFFLNKPWWWMIAAMAITVSQFLIILYWENAKFGTIINLILLIVLLPAYGKWNVERQIQNELGSLLSTQTKSLPVITEKMVDELPPVIQKWVNRSNVVGKEMASSVQVWQKGEMRTKKDASWMKVSAEQYFNLREPGFIWIADVKAAPLISLSGRDMYLKGKGNMLIKALSLVPVADSKGQEIDQGSMLRYLAEIVWFPSQALSEYISWEQLNSNQARATMDYNGMNVSGVFTFDESGDVLSFEAKRYYDRKEGATLETWLIMNEDFKEFEGIRAPSRSTVTWKLDQGDFTWYKLEITDIKYNR